MFDQPSSVDWVGVEDPWIGAHVNLVALKAVVCEVLRVPASQCDPPVVIGQQHLPSYARVYSFQLPTCSVVARLVAPVKPLFKTENEVAAMDFVRSRTSLPVPTVFAYCSEATNPVGAEWVIMEHMPGVEMGVAWGSLNHTQKQTLALGIIDLYDQLFQLKANMCGGIYHPVHSVDDLHLNSSFAKRKCSRSQRWRPLSADALCMLRSHCTQFTNNGFMLGPIHDIALLDYLLIVPPSSHTLPTSTSEEYVRLLAFNGNPATRSDYDFPTREKCVELFQSIRQLYPTSSLFGPSEVSNFRFSHGDLHKGNILVDPRSGTITGIIDWEAAAFRPSWAEAYGVGWFDEDPHRFLFGADEPENFANESHSDQQLRAFFRTQLHKRNPDLFACFLGGIELRAVLHAAVDSPRPIGETNIFLSQYYKEGYWNEDRRGAFPWDMNAWLHHRIDLDEEHSDRVEALKRAESALS